MKKSKRLLSILLTVAMMLSLAVPSVMAADFSDVSESYHYYTAIQSLVARGIINGYEEENGTFTFKPEATITRAEFCKMIIYSIGLSSMAESVVSETGFPDVSPEHWAAGAIKTAFDLKIINGFDDGTFKPGEPVTYDQAIKMTVCAKYDKLGEAAMKNGGYPTGYRKVANSYGFTKNVIDGVFDQPAKRGTIAKLVDNMMGVKLSEITDDPTAVESDQQVEVKGQVVAVYGASIEDTLSTLTKYQVKIKQNDGYTVIYNGENLAIKDDLRSLLGKLVVAYYKDEMAVDVLTLTGIDEQRGRNDEIVVDLDEVVAAESDTSFIYEDKDGDREKVAVDSDAKIVYNGSLSASGFKALVDANVNNSGNIRFLSTSGSSGAADVVFISAYKNYQVTSVSRTSKTVYLDDGTTVTSMVIDDDARNKTVSILKNGKSAAFSAVVKNQILSIAKDKETNENFIEVLIGPDPFTGRVSAMTRGEGKLTINSKEYTFAAGTSYGTDIEVGSNLKVYLDAFGKIAKYEIQAASVNYSYAYLTQIRNVGTGIDADLRIEVVNLSSGTIKKFDNYPLADTVSINNKNYKTETDFLEIQALLEAKAAEFARTISDKDFGAGVGEVYQPIKYSLTDGAVSHVLIGGTTDAELKVNTEGLDTAIKCTTNYTGLAGIYNLTSSTKVLWLPENDKLNDYSKYTLKPGNNSGLAIGNTYNLLLVDLNSSGTPSLVVVYNVSGSTITTNDWINYLPGIVTKKSSDDTYDKITVYGSFGEKVYLEDDTDFYDSINVGDVIRVAADNQNVIDDIEVVAVASEIFNGTNYVKVGAHQLISGAKVDFVEKSGSYAKEIREGGNYTEDRANLSYMAGTVYSYIDGTLMVALDYLTEGEVWDKVTLGNNELLKSIVAAQSVPTIAVTMDGDTVKNISTNAEISEVIPYTTDGNSINTEANKVFVYRSANNAKLVIIFRAD